MTNGETPNPESGMEDPSGVSGSMNLSIDLPDNLRIRSGAAVTGGSPTGTIVAFAGDTSPEGWLICDGAAVNRTTYSDLFALVSTKYGVGNGSTTFNLPDLRGRFPLGRDNMGNAGDRSADRVLATTAEAVGRSGGAETHTLTIDQMPKHSHGVDHAFRNTNGGYGTLVGNHVGSNTIETSSPHEDWTTPGVPGDPVGGHLIKNRGGGQAHNNMPPYQTLNYIIKT